MTVMSEIGADKLNWYSTKVPMPTIWDNLVLHHLSISTRIPGMEVTAIRPKANIQGKGLQGQIAAT